MPTYDGTSNLYKRHSLLHFTIDNQAHTLTIYQSVDLFKNPTYKNYLFLPFLDDTNGDQTYEGGRYLELDASNIKNGSITIDFNRAYNPYCAYSSGYRCPQPSAENTLAIAIFAGEKKYIGPKNERPVNKANAKNFNETESALILSDDTTTKFRVYQITNENELAVLQASSTDIKYDAPLLETLARRMLLTVQDSTHPGVGIAAPQVGINKNVIWVQRFDKDDKPFEFYINPKIIWRSKLTREGAEGCLSIPDRKENVQRSYAIRLQYLDKKGNIIEENVEGFTSVIFQHEVDHLYGILYPDRLEEQAKKERIPLQDKINFSIEAESILP
ncbi:peptide deformylase [Sphingobacterium pedocola]|uniref:peptide deformylase n=1 Tax=Sphingobacterium pedocola TaxID=2082722 RepID=UPI001E28CB07|nr:peptide deformylase [Sphingobacterium pedocola]